MNKEDPLVHMLCTTEVMTRMAPMRLTIHSRCGTISIAENSMNECDEHSSALTILADGSRPRFTAKKVAEPLKVFGVLLRNISQLLFQATRAQHMQHALMPREVILSSWVVAEAKDGGV